MLHVKLKKKGSFLFFAKYTICHECITKALSLCIFISSLTSSSSNRRTATKGAVYSLSAYLLSWKLTATVCVCVAATALPLSLLYSCFSAKSNFCHVSEIIHHVWLTIHSDDVLCLEEILLEIICLLFHRCLLPSAQKTFFYITRRISLYNKVVVVEVILTEEHTMLTVSWTGILWWWVVAVVRTVNPTSSTHRIEK